MTRRLDLSARPVNLLSHTSLLSMLLAIAFPSVSLAQDDTSASSAAASSGSDGEELEELPSPDLSARAGGDRPTVQRRFAPKDNLLYGTATLLTHVRDDFYDSWGGGVDIGYFAKESIGYELRVARLRTSLDNAAIDLKERIGLTPDARPQDAWLMAGIRYAPGYGKMLMWERFIVHFDPQLVMHLGVARAEKRLIPSADLSFSLLTHWRWGIKAKLDLGMTMQLEQRDRGWTFSTGFAPVLGVGWGYNF